MTTEKQRIEIAKWCGWTFKTIGDGVIYPVMPDGGFPGQVPDYLNDLNAIHQAEAKLTGEPNDEDSQKTQFSEQLVMVCANGQEVVDIWFWHQIHATASQRAEALLKTIGKWTAKKG